jgi:hypothetical protein
MNNKLMGPTQGVAADGTKEEAGVKLTKAQDRLRNALQFLQDFSDGMRQNAPRGDEDAYAAVHWWAREPSYCWKTAYGDFSPATLAAGIRAGLIAKDGHRPCFRITPAGRLALHLGERTDG